VGKLKAGATLTVLTGAAAFALLAVFGGRSRTARDQRVIEMPALRDPPTP
jgi:hypothetical protein